jgi:hypothetical protein
MAVAYGLRRLRVLPKSQKDFDIEEERRSHCGVKVVAAIRAESFGGRARNAWDMLMRANSLFWRPTKTSSMSAFGGKADIPSTDLDVRF